MARTMRMLSEEDLPRGTVRDFMDLWFYFYKSARRPTLREISDRINKSELSGTASTETIRRMLRGLTVPAHWETVEAVLVVLSDLANRGPDSLLNWDGTKGTRREHVERLWHQALDNPDLHYGQPEADPWATDGPGGYPDEPPF